MNFDLLFRVALSLCTAKSYNLTCRRLRRPSVSGGWIGLLIAAVGQRFPVLGIEQSQKPENDSRDPSQFLGRRPLHFRLERLVVGMAAKRSETASNAI